ncbi:MAG TPA: Hint domain-containing protein, partial [Alphaproteobacteria bacterium]|nr:Hint domain-containing protein [Alphaproteobacteria bacterium]
TQAVRLQTGGSVTNAAGGVLNGRLLSLGAGASTTLDNSGTILNAIGIYSTGTNSLINEAGGLISVAGGAVRFQNGTFENFGTIIATGAAGDGVILSTGASFTNEAGGVINAGRDGVYMAGAQVTIENAGTIIGSQAVYLRGTMANHLVVDGGAVFQGAVQARYGSTNVLELSAKTGAGTISGIGGTIQNFTTITIDSGARWDIGTISAAATVLNAGTIGAHSTIGVALTNGTIINSATGTIDGSSYGVQLGTPNYGTVDNSGVIAGTGGVAVALDGGGRVTNEQHATISGVTYGIRAVGRSSTVDNFGTIGATGTAGVGVHLGQGGNVTNEAGAEILAGQSGVRLVMAGTVVNHGTIVGVGGTGVDLEAGGVLRNLSGGTITGSAYGVLAHGASATVENAGTINGSVYLYASGSNRLILDPGAVINGDVFANQRAVNVMELASAASDGTLSGFYARYFQTLAIDSGAQWEIGAIPPAHTIVNAGTVGAHSYDGIDLSHGSVTNLSSGTIIGAGHEGVGVHITAGLGAVVNSGRITVGGVGYAVELDGGGTVTNAAGGTIVGVVIQGGDASLGNAGYLAGKGQNDAARLSGFYSTLVNTGTIAGFAGAQIGAYAQGILINTGKILGSTAQGVILSGSAVSVDNIGTISGYMGIFAFASYTTIENAGTIAGAYTAMYLGGSHNRLILDPGAVIKGDVFASSDGDASNAIELKSGAAAGTLNGLGSTYKYFGAVTIDSGATWTVAGTKAGFNSATITGFGSHDRLDLTDLAFNAGDTVDSVKVGDVSDVLTIKDSHGTPLATIYLTGDFAGDFFHLANDTQHGSYITEDETPCYLRGTLIRTADGEVPVERLRIGHWVVTQNGEARPIKWIGRRSYRDWNAAGNDDAQPVCFKAGSIADGIPMRDLYVSPEHAMSIDDVLVPARHLVNGASILKAQGMEEIEYFHLEFDRHVIIFAEGAAAESFVDDDSRMLFHNADEYRLLYPDEQASGRAEFCAPRVEVGPKLAAIHRKLAKRATHLRPDGSAAPWGQRGKVEVTTNRLVAGWAYSGADAGPQALAVLLNGAVVGRVVADRFRADLKAAGIGDGRHGFRFGLPKGLAGNADRRIEVRREIDWSLL